MTTQKRTLRLKVSGIAVLLLAGVASPLRAQEANQRTTSFEQVVAPVPWLETFQLGAGVDAVTGGVAGTAVKPFSPSAPRVKTSNESMNFIANEEKLRQEIEASLSGKYNIVPGIDAKASMSYLNKLSFSQNSAVLVAKYVSSTDYAEANTYELTEEAASLMKSDPTAFRKTYGDYFVAGVRKGSRFVALYRMWSSSKENLDRFKGSIGGEGADVFKANVGAKFEREAKSKNVNYDISVFMDGYMGAYQRTNKEEGTPEEVTRALDWFKENEVGKPFVVKLRHYSTLDRNYPRTINIDPEVFADLNRLYTNLWEVRALYSSLPEGYSQRHKMKDKPNQNLKDAYGRFDTAVTTNREVLGTDMRLRNDLTTAGSELASELRIICARRAFFEEVQSRQKYEPPTGQMIGCQTDAWKYGYSPADPYMAQVATAVPGAVQIENLPRSFSPNWELAKRQSTAFAFNDPTKLIVGWTVISNWGGDHNGEWWKATNGPILLNTQGVVGVRGEETRGTNWTVIFYYVNANDYQFHTSL